MCVLVCDSIKVSRVALGQITIEGGWWYVRMVVVVLVVVVVVLVVVVVVVVVVGSGHGSGGYLLSKSICHSTCSREQNRENEEHERVVGD